MKFKKWTVHIPTTRKAHLLRWVADDLGSKVCVCVCTPWSIPLHQHKGDWRHIQNYSKLRSQRGSQHYGTAHNLQSAGGHQHLAAPQQLNRHVQLNKVIHGTQPPTFFSEMQAWKSNKTRHCITTATSCRITPIIWCQVKSAEVHQLPGLLDHQMKCATWRTLCTKVKMTTVSSLMPTYRVLWLQ